MTTTTTKVRVSKSTIAAFVREMFKHVDAGTYVMLRAFNTDNTTFGSWKTPKLNGGSRDALVEAAFKAADNCVGQPGRPVFCPPIATFKSSYGMHASTANLANGLVLTVECDTGAQAARTKLETLLGPATLVVASGGKWTDDAGGEDDKLHLHWRLGQPTRTPEEHEMLRQARVMAARIVGADLTAGPPVHPIRWPGSVHQKSENRLCRVIDFVDRDINLENTLVILECMAPPVAKGRKGSSV